MKKWLINFVPYLAGLSIRKSIKQSANLIPFGTYRYFSLSSPRISGVIEGYDVQFGASIWHRTGGELSVQLFEKVKFKQPPQISMIMKDSFNFHVNNEFLSIEWGWLTRRHDISQINETNSNGSKKSNLIAYKKPYEICLQVKQLLEELMLSKSNNLIEITKNIENNTLDITTEISEKTSYEHREFLIGLLVAGGAIIVFWVLWHFLINAK